MKNKIKHSIYQQMQKFASLTITMILKGNVARAKRCFDAVEKLYKNGSSQTRLAISNVYIYHISSILELHHYDVRKLLPLTLRAEYIKQINAY